MKSKQYFISTKDGKIEVKGYRVVIPGYEQFSFFAHRPYYGHVCKTDWAISEETTGLGCMPSSWSGGYSNSTVAGAIHIFTDTLKARLSNCNS